MDSTTSASAMTPRLRHCDSNCDLHGTVRIGYEVHNQETAEVWVVFVAGVAAARGMWDRQVAALAPTTGAISVDNRGIGDSDVPEGGYSTEAMAADILAVVDDVLPAAAAGGVEAPAAAVHVVGHSLGGMISCKVAARLAERSQLGSLTVLSSSLGGWFNMIPPITAKLFKTLPKLATATTAHRRASADLDCHYTDAYVEEHRDVLMREYVDLSNSQRRFDEGRRRAKTGEDGHLKAVLFHKVTAADLAAIKASRARVLVAHGRYDFVAGVSAGRTLWRTFRDAGCATADYHVLHGAHFITREREDEINGLVDAQIRGAPLDGAPDETTTPVCAPPLRCYALLCCVLALVAVLLVVAFATDAVPSPASLDALSAAAPPPPIQVQVGAFPNATYATWWVANSTHEPVGVLRVAARAGAFAARVASASA